MANSVRKIRGRNPIPDQERKTYNNRSYVRLVAYPRTHKMVRAKSKKAGKTMIDWLDEAVKEAK